jgi:hypothetical protein
MSETARAGAVHTHAIQSKVNVSEASDFLGIALRDIWIVGA